LIEFRDSPIVGAPPHPFWFWRNIPFIGIGPAD
jgi:hypothetical protein